MLPIVTVEQMRELDRATIDDIGIPGLAMMEVAGRAVADAAATMLAGCDGAGGHVAVVCGPGNNGGDGYVVARALRARGIDATTYLAVPRSAVRGDALRHLEILERSGGVVRSIATPPELAAAAGDHPRPALAVDALFGVGPLRAIEGHLAEVVAWVNAAGLRLAVDVPSGLDADTGQVRGVCVRAHRTVTMGALKLAHVGAPGFPWCGIVEIADIGIPRARLADVRIQLLDASDVRAKLPRGSELDHKGRRGHVVVVSGAEEMRGAARLAATAALRVGAGLVTLAGDGDVIAPAPVMTAGLDIAALLPRSSAIVIGPGLGTTEDARARLEDVLTHGSARTPTVLDADALNLLASEPARLRATRSAVVITPHPGEAGRLLGVSAADIEADRIGAARQLHRDTAAIVVLKGARTIVCDGDVCTVNPTGSPALATAGSGDVLAGAIAGLLAQGLAPADAARVAVYVHGLAGERLGAQLGRGVMSSDLPLAIAAVLTQIPRPG